MSKISAFFHAVLAFLTSPAAVTVADGVEVAAGHPELVPITNLAAAALPSVMAVAHDFASTGTQPLAGTSVSVPVPAQVITDAIHALPGVMRVATAAGATIPDSVTAAVAVVTAAQAATAAQQATK